MQFVRLFCFVLFGCFLFQFTILVLLRCTKWNTWLSYWLKNWFIQVLVSYPSTKYCLRPVPLSKTLLISHFGKMQYFWCSQDPRVLKKCEYFIALFRCQLCLFECTTSASGMLSRCEYIIAVIIFFRLPLHFIRSLSKTISFASLRTWWTTDKT